MYENATDVIPRSLLKEIQKYVQGREIYIPKQVGNHLRWGERNGTREQLDLRNKEICQNYRKGIPVERLMEMYHLSYDSIRRIIRGY